MTSKKKETSSLWFWAPFL